MEVEGLGARCSLPSCRTLDYLPFRCNACKLPFCQTHAQPADHACSVARPNTVPVCPLCSAPVPVPPGSTADIAVSRHIEAGCPKRRRSNPVCALPGCNVRDPAATACRACQRVFCLAHCLEQNHDCPVAGKAAVPSRSMFSALPSLRRAHQNAPKTSQKVTTSKPVAKPHAPVSSSAPQSASKQRYRLDFANKPTAPLGDSKIDVEYRAPFAVVFPPSSNLQPRYMFFSQKNSAGKIIDTVRKLVPQLPPAPAGSRYSLYAVKQDLSSVNLLPHITPITELRNIIGPNDFLVLDTSPNGLDPTLVSSFRTISSPSPLSTLSRKSGKCIVA